MNLLMSFHNNLSMSTYNILIAVLSNNNYCSFNTTQTLLNIQKYFSNKNITIDIHFFNDDDLSNTKNNAIATFLSNQQYTHLLFMNYKMIFQPTVIESLVSKNKPIIGACVPLEGFKWNNT